MEASNQGNYETTYPEKELTSVHVNLPTSLWNAVEGIAKYLSTTKTNIVVRALDNHAYFMRVLKEDPKARIAIERGNGEREYVSFPELSRTASAAPVSSRAALSR
jgi:hypothetical protein